ncbi:unnamed protein product [Rhizophagus irregularis]|nr:unnamed protein product [Rhizophagus irregularis]
MIDNVGDVNNRSILLYAFGKITTDDVNGPIQTGYYEPNALFYSKIRNIVDTRKFLGYSGYSASHFN